MLKCRAAASAGSKRNCFNCAAWPSFFAVRWNDSMAASPQFKLWRLRDYEIWIY
jgi:hypothetical protein